MTWTFFFFYLYAGFNVYLALTKEMDSRYLEGPQKLAILLACLFLWPLQPIIHVLLR